MWSDFRTELWKWALGSGSTAALALATLHMNELLSQNNPAFPEPAVRICIILTSARNEWNSKFGNVPDFALTTLIVV